MRVKRTKSNNIIVFDAGPPPVCPPDLARTFLLAHYKMYPKEYPGGFKDVVDKLRETYPEVEFKNDGHVRREFAE